MKNRVKLLSTELVDSPGILRWAKNGYRTSKDRRSLQNMLMEGFGFTREFADKLLSGQVPYAVEGDAVVIVTPETIFQPGRRPAPKGNHGPDA